MKLQDLAAPQQIKQVAKVFESYFGDKIAFDRLPRKQAQQMLQRVRSLVKEHRRTPEFHYSEKNPAYLKLVMMEQVLSAQLSEMTPLAANPAQQAALATAQQQQKKKQMQDQIKANQDQIKALQQENTKLQQQMNMPTAMESKLQKRLREASEIQQAQVVLASQDMVDQVQKMIEQVTSMQYKDLPALVDSIKNEVGVDQSVQFNTDASGALTALVQNLQGTKQQLETALGVVTGQAPVVPGQDVNQMAPELPPPGEEISATDVSIEEPAPEPEAEPAPSTLGRGRR